MEHITVIGAGNWGTALALTLARKGLPVRIWAYEPEVVESILRRRENSLYMPGVELPAGIVPTGDLRAALAGAAIVLTVMPSHVCRGLFERMLPWLEACMIFVSATKGIETESLMRMSQVIEAVIAPRFQPRLCVLSGPSFAKEVVRGDPTAVVVASVDGALAARVQQVFSSESLRLYTSTDVIGVELGGAVKNVIAIAAGVIAGLGLGHNTNAALLTRGLAELNRLACACGARPETLAGLAGMGDLALTCTSDLSRNRTVGYELGRGRSLQEIVGSMRMVAEGVKTTRATYTLARKLGIEVPITRQVHRLLEGEVTPREAIRELMDRSLKEE